MLPRFEEGSGENNIGHVLTRWLNLNAKTQAKNRAWATFREILILCG
jgi:hypothetical protein